jgi:Holliday junction DNA helicase RuvB
MDENINIRKEIISPNDKEFEKQLRPLSFDDFKGQKQVIDNLEVFVTAAKQRGESLDHVLRDWEKQPLPV